MNYYMDQLFVINLTKKKTHHKLPVTSDADGYYNVPILIENYRVILTRQKGGEWCIFSMNLT